MTAAQRMAAAMIRIADREKRKKRQKNGKHGLLQTMLTVWKDPKLLREASQAAIAALPDPASALSADKTLDL